MPKSCRCHSEISAIHYCITTLQTLKAEYADASVEHRFNLTSVSPFEKNHNNIGIIRKLT
eukprot:Pgem_evm1s313